MSQLYGMQPTFVMSLLNVLILSLSCFLSHLFWSESYGRGKFIVMNTPVLAYSFHISASMPRSAYK